MGGTSLKGRSNPMKPQVSDPDAHLAVKQSTHGKTEFKFGYKLYLLVDCEYELPLAANVTPANVHDFRKAGALLSEARRYAPFRPAYVMAGSGYSSKALIRLVRRQYWAQPIININKAHKKLQHQFAEAMKSREWRALYSQRQAVERGFSLLKRCYSLLPFLDSFAG